MKKGWNQSNWWEPYKRREAAAIKPERHSDLMRENRRSICLDAYMFSLFRGNLPMRIVDLKLASPIPFDKILFMKV